MSKENPLYLKTATRTEFKDFLLHKDLKVSESEFQLIDLDLENVNVWVDDFLDYFFQKRFSLPQ